MNLFELAIKNDEIVDLFRGRNQYFFEDSERRGVHDAMSTINEIFTYGNVNSSELFIGELEKSIGKYLALEDFSQSDLIFVLNIIWVYFVFKTENKLGYEWSVSNRLKLLIRKKIENNQIDPQKIRDIIDKMKIRFQFDLFH